MRIAFNKKTGQTGDEAQDSAQQAAACLHKTSDELILNLALNPKIRILKQCNPEQFTSIL